MLPRPGPGLAVAALLVIGLAPTAASAAAPVPSLATSTSTAGQDTPDDTARDAAFDAYQTGLKPLLAVPTDWTGSTARCDAGRPSTASRDASLAAVNYFRRTAGLHPVALDPALDDLAQQAALMMEANGALSHDPPTTWKCYTDAGHRGAATSILGLGFPTGPAAMAGLMHESRGDALVGHRRWMLLPSQRVLGLGTTGRGHALHVFAPGDDTDTGPAWVPWPVAGHSPSQTEPDGQWSLSAPDRTTDFSQARVRVSSGGGDLPVQVEPLHDGYGNNALVWQVTTGYGVKQADRAYDVSVTGIRRNGATLSHSYRVVLFDGETDARQTVNLPPVSDARYGDSVPISATASSALPVRLTTTTPAVCAADGTTVRLVGVGTCTVSADQPGDAIRRPAPLVTTSFRALPRPVTVRADDQAKDQGEENPPLTYAYQGLAPGETTPTGATGAPSCTTPATRDSAPGGYPITCDTAGLTSPNHVFTAASGTLTVRDARPPGVTLSATAIDAGQPVTVIYTGSPGAVVEVLSRTQPATAFTRIATVTLDAAGRGTTVHRPQKNTRITAQTAGGTASADQPLVQVRSIASLTVRRSTGRAYTLTGRVFPARAGRTVSLYRNGRLFAQAASDATGVYAVTRSLPAGTSSLQGRTGDDTYNLGTRTPSRTVTVR